MKCIASIPAVGAIVLGALVGIGSGQSKSAVLQKAGLSAEARAAILTVGDDVKKLDKSHENYVRAAARLDALYVKLLQKSREVVRLAAAAEKTKPAGQDRLFKAIREMAEMDQSFNLQYLQLQQDMQNENRQFTLVSNVMKTKHDTAKNAINNIR